MENKEAEEVESLLLLPLGAAHSSPVFGYQNSRLFNPGSLELVPLAPWGLLGL
jgi:hypothetical protein